MSMDSTVEDEGMYLGCHYTDTLKDAFGPEARVYVEDLDSPTSFEAVQKAVADAHAVATLTGKNHLVVITRCNFTGFHAKPVLHEKIGRRFYGHVFTTECILPYFLLPHDWDLTF